jgi:integration host factor subunit alpha
MEPRVMILPRDESPTDDEVEPGAQDLDSPELPVILPSLETPTLTKAELAELLFERLGLNKRESKDMVEAFFEIIHVSLVKGEDVKLSGFGNFNIRRKAPRPGRNPRTGEAIPIKARNVVTFHASHKLKGIVQGDIPLEGEFE